MINRLFAIASLVACLVAQASAQSGGFPKGDIKGPFVWKSTIYPGTEREYWVYVPKHYDAAKPACTMILQDGLTRANGWKLPTVLDSLIALKQIPVIIGIFIDHGKVPAAGADNWPRFNRSFEYDALGDRYAKFLIEEIIPEVTKTYNLSKDPNDRSIAGASSGAICAFNAAWERPNEFRRVLSTIGTYVGLRGGDEFPTLVRKTEPKPLRVFLEDGSGDLNIYGGDWWTANQAMLSALTWAGYEVNHAWGTEGHNSKGAVKILPEALKWLWKDYPQPVKTHAGPVQRFNPLIEGEPWRLIAAAKNPTELAVNSDGNLCFSTTTSIFRLTVDESISLIRNGLSRGLSFGGDGRLYTFTENEGLISLDEKGNPSVISDSKGTKPGKHDRSLQTGRNLIVGTKGIYFLGGLDEVCFYSFKTKSIQIYTAKQWGDAVALSADQTFLHISCSPLGASMKVSDDGTLDHWQEYTHYHVPYGVREMSMGGMAVDTENRLYTATEMGIQITDQLGRVNFIIPGPEKDALDVKFGGADFSTLYVISNGNLYSRKVSTRGVLPFLPPVKPPKPGL